MQEDLFGVSPIPRGRSIEAEPQGPLGSPADQTALPRVVHLGTSSWSFPGWEGVVYAGRHSPGRLARDGLRAYARHPLLRTVGVDRGYYRPMDRAVLEAMARQVPADFRFVVKAPVQVTGPTLQGRGRTPINPDFLDPRVAAELAVRPFLDGLGDRAGVLLFQFPPTRVEAPSRVAAFLDHLARFLEALPCLPSGAFHAVELRDEVLWGPRLKRVLNEAGAIPGYAVHPTLPTLGRQFEIIPPEAYPATLVRWLLPPGLGYEEARELHAPFRRLGSPDPEHRHQIVDLCLGGIHAGRPTFVIANNKAEGSAPLSIVEIARALRSGEIGPPGEGGPGEKKGRARQDSNLGPSA